MQTFVSAQTCSVDKISFITVVIPLPIMLFQSHSSLDLKEAYILLLYRYKSLLLSTSINVSLFY